MKSSNPLHHRSNQLVLIGFCFLYPLLFFPGAVFETPGLITDSTRGVASERFLLLPKLIFLTAVAVLGGIQVWRMVRPTLFAGLMGLHLFLVTLSTINAQDEPTYNLLGPYLRLDGLVYHFSITVLAVFAYLIFKHNKSLPTTVIHSLVASGTVQALLMLAQRFHLDPIGPFVRWGEYTFSAGTLAHPGIAAGFLLPLVLMGTWLVANNSFKPYWGVWSVLTMALAMSVSGNRAALIGLGIGCVIVLFYNRRLATWALVAAVLLVAFGGRNFLPNPQTYNRNYVEATTVNTRLAIWPFCLGLLKHIPYAPVLGGGPDAIKITTLRNVPAEDLLPLFSLELSWPENTVVRKATYKQSEPGSLRTTTLEVDFKQYGELEDHYESYPMLLDRAHNFWLDRLLAFGMFSVVVWLLLFGLPILRLISRPQSPSFGVAIGMVGLLVYYLAWFPTLQAEPIYIVLLAMLWAKE